jgi:predicted alpha/beta-hydrolase family hydrolase
VLGHGAGGSVAARDLVAVARLAVAAGITAVLVEQPYRVAGRQSSPPARHLDAAWCSVVAQLRDGPLGPVPLVVGGRSAGARVACRTAAESGAAAVLCLAFPLQPPARAGKPPAPSRQAELDAVQQPTLVVQGAADRFGMPQPSATRTIVAIAGDHRLVGDLPALARAVEDWLAVVVGAAG